MITKKNIWIYILSAGLSWFLVSCAGPQVMEMEQIPMTENPTEYVNRLDRDLSKARNEQLNVLVPEAFTKAETYLSNAKRGLKRGDELSEIFENVSLGRAELNNAKETVKVVKTVLQDVIAARSLARAAGATQFEKDYGNIEEDFLLLTKAIERNNLDWAKQNQKRVSNDFRLLELRAIKERTLGEVRELLRLAEKAGAKKIAPETFAKAQQKLKDTDLFISEQRYQTEEIRKKADEALFYAQRLSQVVHLSEKMQAMKPEQISLYIEGILQQITERLSATDMSNEPLELQIEHVIGSISVLQNDRQFMIEKLKSQQAQMDEIGQMHQSEIAFMTQQLASLEGKTREEQSAKKRLEEEKRAAVERLAAEQQFNQLYNEVQKFFVPDEAEVYKQGYQLVIRLKEMKFPVGKSIIMPGNYQLLSKVQRAIRTFGDPGVIVEGHTDSTGSEAVNEQLSQQRAESVREYLVANRTLTVDKIVAVGYGSQRPLASNETPEGRAINRRIDVIIKPEILEELDTKVPISSRQ